ncbi:MAG: sensor domain-containing diguanylate cyclase [Actinobacteria bacterium]|nr:sensor domain-containing diguanylate cyclase [Actinomycetota bacterium]
MSSGGAERVKRAWLEGSTPAYLARAVRSALLASFTAIAVVAVYTLLSPPTAFSHLAAFIVLGVATIASVGLGMLPWKTLFGGRAGIVLLSSWSFVDIVLISVGVAITGQVASPLWSLYFLVVAFGATCYGPMGQMVTYLGVAGGYLATLHVLGSTTADANLAVRLGTLGVATLLSAFLATERRLELRNHMAARDRAQALAHALSASEARFRAMVQRAPDLIIIVEAAGNIRYASPASMAILGLEPQQLIERRIMEFIHPDDARVVNTVLKGLTRGMHFVIECRLLTTAKSWCWVEAVVTDMCMDPSVDGYVVNIREITERKLTETKLAYQALHDSLTGLANRTLLVDRLTQALARRQRAGNEVTVIYLDVDKFKSVNDTYGHQTGDAVLVTLATRLQEGLRSSDTAARLGGDEFAIVLEHSEPSLAEDITSRMRNGLSTPCHCFGHDLVISASVGIARASAITATEDPAQAALKLIASADQDMYLAKARRGSSGSQDMESDQLVRG